LLRDYVAEEADDRVVREELRTLSAEQLSDSAEIARALGYGPDGQLEELFIKPRGYRQLERVPRLPRRVAESLIRAFGSLEEILDATEEELDEVEGVGQARARTIQRGLERQRSLETTGEVS
jgi:diadenylate cyclase